MDLMVGNMLNENIKTKMQRKATIESANAKKHTSPCLSLGRLPLEYPIVDVLVGVNLRAWFTDEGRRIGGLDVQHATSKAARARIRQLPVAEQIPKDERREAHIHRLVLVPQLLRLLARVLRAARLVERHVRGHDQRPLDLKRWNGRLS